VGSVVDKAEDSWFGEDLTGAPEAAKAKDQKYSMNSQTFLNGAESLKFPTKPASPMS
jgi:hypothetical protein